MTVRPIIGMGMGLATISSRPRSRYILGFLLENPRRTKSQSNDKGKTGKAIKQLNSENKYLFGELLDRPNKTRAASKQTSWRPSPRSKPEQPLDGIQSELSWYKSTSLLSPIRVSESELINNGTPGPKSTLAFSKSNHISVGLDRDVSPGLPHQHLTNDTRLPSAARDNTEVIGLGLTSVGTNSIWSKPGPIPDSDLLKPSLELPDIIVRNISTFPLFNNEKITEDPSSHNEGVILSISRDNSKYSNYPSVTKVLNATMSDASRAALARWRQKMIAELGEEGFLKYSNDLLAKGSEFHRTVHDHLSGIPSTELTIGADIEGSWQSLSSVIPDLSNVKVLESHVVHPKLMYRGVIDCVASYKGKTAVVEWKKSDKQKKELAYTYDAPLQLAAYLGAVNYDPHYHFQVRGGVVVVAYTDGTPAQVFQLSQSECARYWSLWLHRLHLYWQQQATLSAETIASAL